MSRPLGAIPAASLSADRKDWFHFVRIDAGTMLRFTNYPADSVAFNIEGTSQTWDGTRGAAVSEITYGQNTPLSGATVDLGNLDDYFSDLANTRGTLREMPVSIWRGYFETVSGAVIGPLEDKILVFEGVTDRADVGDLCSLAIVPISEFSLMPKRRIDTRLFPYLPRQDVVFSWGDVTVDLTQLPGSTSNTGYVIDPTKSRGGVTVVDPRTRDPINVGFR